MSMYTVCKNRTPDRLEVCSPPYPGSEGKDGEVDGEAELEVLAGGVGLSQLGRNVLVPQLKERRPLPTLQGHQKLRLQENRSET